MALANELRPFGITVCAVMPGDIHTGFTAARAQGQRGRRHLRRPHFPLGRAHGARRADRHGSRQGGRHCQGRASGSARTTRSTPSAQTTSFRFSLQDPSGAGAQPPDLRHLRQMTAAGSPAQNAHEAGKPTGFLPRFFSPSGKTARPAAIRFFIDKQISLDYNASKNEQSKKGGICRMNFSIAISERSRASLTAPCASPLCRQLELPQTAFDILMFLGNNPDYKTASEIVEIRHIKANLVSVNVDRLVREGYLTRRGGGRPPEDGTCTEKAAPILAAGGSCKTPFLKGCLPVWTKEARRAFSEAMHLIEKANLNAIGGRRSHEHSADRSGHIFCGHGRGARHRLCRDERRRSHQPHADHVSGR